MQIVTGWMAVALGLSTSSGLVLGGSWTKVDSGLPRSPVSVGTVVVDPSSPSTVYALGGRLFRSLFKSTDSGGTWNIVGGVSSVGALVIDPSDSSTLYAVANRTVVKSTDGGQSWTGTGFGLVSASTLAIDPQNTSTLYAIADSAIFKTTDGGASWYPKTTGLPASWPGGYLARLAIVATDPSTIYATLGDTGLYKSIDGGESWRGLIPARGGFCDCPVAIDPVHPSTVYATSFYIDSPVQGANPSHLFKSTDGGETWSAVNTGVPGYITSLIVDPASTIYASYVSQDTAGGVVKSTDGGASWSAVNPGLPSNPPAVFSLALNPANPSAFFAGYSGGVFSTLDGGANWNDASAGLAITDVHALAVDPVNGATVYAAAGDGVSKSIDGGADWNTVHFSPTSFAATFPPPFVATTIVSTLLIDPNYPQVLYAAFGDANVGSSGDSFLRKSRDGGATWSDLPVHNLICGPVSLAIDPSDSNTLYAVIKNGESDCATSLDKNTTHDGGVSWTETYFPGDVSALVIDPANPATLYAGTAWSFPGTAPRGVSKSTDAGKTWAKAALADFDVNFLVLDPASSNILYAATSLPNPDGTPGMFRSIDGGAAWFAINTGLAGIIGTRTPITALVLDSKRSVLYLGTAGGVFKSIDCGASWNPFNDGLLSLDIRALAVSSDGSGTVYAGTAGGVFRAVDDTAQPVNLRVIRPRIH